MKSLSPNPLYRATTREILHQSWYLQKANQKESHESNIDLSQNIVELRLLHRRRINTYSMFVASGSIQFQRPTRYQDHQVLPTLLSINP